MVIIFLFLKSKITNAQFSEVNFKHLLKLQDLILLHVMMTTKILTNMRCKFCNRYFKRQRRYLMARIPNEIIDVVRIFRRNIESLLSEEGVYLWIVR